MYKLLLICLAMMTFSCDGPVPASKRPLATLPVENIAPTKDQQERRKKSEDVCKSHAVPIYTNPNALFSDPENSVILRTKDEVVKRALALCYIGLKSEGLEQNHLDKMDRDYGIVSNLSPEEKTFAIAKHPTKKQITDASWKYECLHVMLWALGYIDSLSYPAQACEVPADVKIIHDRTAAQFRQNAHLRSKQEIMDQNDLILRLHWACEDARMNNKPMPGRLNNDVVMEWHQALNWLIRYMGEDWDDVTTDT